MAIDKKAKQAFIDGVVQDQLKNIPNPSKEVKDGMEKYATGLCNRITDLLRELTVVNPDGTESTLKIK
jgi:hypothetical protein